MSRRNYHKHDPAPFALYNHTTTASRCISDHKNRGQKNPGKQRSDGGGYCNRQSVLGGELAEKRLRNCSSSRRVARGHQLTAAAAALQGCASE